jgi:UDP-2-acetamido-2,6-beta-L-arabino-hexul-4-ose reductase
VKKIGITGQHGFIGQHLYNTLSLLKDKFELIPFNKSIFQSRESLQKWVGECDVIIHLAALNRHEDENVIYTENLRLANLLKDALAAVDVKPHVIISSSTQEEKDTIYGKSKKEARSTLAAWSEVYGAVFTGLIIPNVFGPFGKPFYNSGIATFCYQLCNSQKAVIKTDALLHLIYIDELCEVFINIIEQKVNNPYFEVAATAKKRVSEVKDQLESYQEKYLERGVLPCFQSIFDRNLFNTFRSYIDHQTFFPRFLKLNTDQRGTFVETVKLEQGGQISFSTTAPGITRGNHFHIRKIERFVVIKGKALIELRKFNDNQKISFELDGIAPAYVDMPVWYTHNITNIGNEELYTIFWINELYNPLDPDTYFEPV